MRTTPRRRRPPTRASLVTLLALTLTGLPTGLAPTAQAVAPSTPASSPVIVVVRPHAALPAATPADAGARGAAVATDQAGASAEVTTSGGHVTRRYQLVDAFAATVSSGEQARLAARPDVAAVLPDRTHLLARTPVARPTAPRTPGGPVRSTTVCTATPTAPETDPEALSLMHVAADDPTRPTAQGLADGHGVRVGVVGNGVDVDDPDLVRADGSHVVVDYRDFVGTGTEAPTEAGESMGDVASIAAQGRQTYRLPGVPTMPDGCTIRVLGVATGADVVALKAFGADSFNDSTIVAAIDYAVVDEHVDVLSESFGGAFDPDDDATPIALADAAAVDAGVSVVSASGDTGRGNTVLEPAASAREAAGHLAVGASTQLRAFLQRGYFTGPRAWNSDDVAYFSSSGVAQTGRTLDVLAPGYAGWSLCSTDVTRFPDCAPGPGVPAGLQYFQGTSESAPLTAGVAALVVDRYRRTHAGRSPSPQLVKQIITSTADDVGAPADEQGAGVVDGLRAVRLAASAGRTAPAVTSDLLVGPSQLSFSGEQGQSHQASLTLTDPAGTPRRVTVATRTSRLTGTQRFVLPFGPGGSVLDIPFTVAPGTDRISVDTAWPDPTYSNTGFLDLITPSGDIANDTESMGVENALRGEAERPVAGTWTLEIGVFGPIGRGAAVLSSYHDAVGAAQPVTVPAGGSATATFTVPAPDDAGDHALAAVVADATTGRVLDTVPAVVRDVLALTSGSATFSGTLHSGVPAVVTALVGSEHLYVDVPAGLPAFHVAIAFPRTTGQDVVAYLAAPSGAAVDRQTSLPPGGTDPATGGPEVDLYATAPPAGRWEVGFGISGPLGGQSTTVPYSGAVLTGSAPVTATGLPTSPSSRLTAGAPHSATVHVVNTTASPQAYVLDARRPDAVVRQLSGPGSVTVTPAGGASADVVVPPETELVTAALTAPSPLVAVFGPVDLLQDGFTTAPEAYGASPTGEVVLGTSDPALPDGPWRVFPSAGGPFPSGGATAPFPVTTSVLARLRAFDTSVRTSTGDPWWAAVGLAGPAATPVVVPPGGSADLIVTITPTATAGTVARGTLFLEDWNTQFDVAGQVAALPYAYRVD